MPTSLFSSMVLGKVLLILIILVSITYLILTDFEIIEIFLPKSSPEFLTIEGCTQKEVIEILDADERHFYFDCPNEVYGIIIVESGVVTSSDKLRCSLSEGFSRQFLANIGVCSSFNG